MTSHNPRQTEPSANNALGNLLKGMLPVYLADADANRALLGRRVVCDLLGFGDDIYRAVRRLAAKWCAEPSVHGGKGRPKDARPAV